MRHLQQKCKDTGYLAFHVLVTALHILVSLSTLSVVAQVTHSLQTTKKTIERKSSHLALHVLVAAGHVLISFGLRSEITIKVQMVNTYFSHGRIFLKVSDSLVCASFARHTRAAALADLVALQLVPVVGVFADLIVSTFRVVFTLFPVA